ncbi:hypothetical protein [Mycobacterium paraterrae]|uniref:Uncharacterized protein n=1 Tax=Mycobacterium paraterrae TaxID=577492 RepID=A0ABY3VJU3_9MYCO|nr:hypothetical protein [Mycobacterium paraterrae]UMB67773.1 hypothetical protein MKK62_14845 [Mycobacterium paraterrae]
MGIESPRKRTEVHRALLRRRRKAQSTCTFVKPRCCRPPTAREPEPIIKIVSFANKRSRICWGYNDPHAILSRIDMDTADAFLL